MSKSDIMASSDEDDGYVSDRPADAHEMRGDGLPHVLLLHDVLRALVSRSQRRRNMVRAALMVYQDKRSSSRKFLVGQIPALEHYGRILPEFVGITMPASVALVPGFVYRATEPTASAHANGPRPAAHGHHAEPAYELVAKFNTAPHVAIPLDV